MLYPQPNWIFLSEISQIAGEKKKNIITNTKMFSSIFFSNVATFFLPNEFPDYIFNGNRNVNTEIKFYRLCPFINKISPPSVCPLNAQQFTDAGE